MPRKFRLSVPKKERKKQDGSQHISSVSTLPVTVSQSPVLSPSEVTLLVSIPLLVPPFPVTSVSDPIVSVPEPTFSISVPLDVYLHAPVESLQALEDRLKIYHLPAST
jgi:hypothetical protein